MSEETYYTVLNVKETASPSEIKTAYRDLIKQVHPDIIENLAPYLRHIAEDKAKEITEAYTILSNFSKRRDYDKQLAAYRRHTTPQAPPAVPTPPPAQKPASTSSGPYCNKCGTALHASGFCPGCKKFGAPSVRPPQTAVRFGYNLGYNGARLMRWSREHAILAVFVIVGAIAFLSTFLIDKKPPQSSATTATTAASFTNNAKAASMGPYSQYPCDSRDKISPIDGKPCREQSASPPPGFVLDGKSIEAHSSTPHVGASGAYVGTVRNKTANLSSTFTVVIHEAENGVLDGCMEVKPPLSGSGALRGSIRGFHVNFVVADITFKGNASRDEMTGSYVVTRQEGNQLGDFHLTKRPGAQKSYGCSDGALIEFERAEVETPKTKPVVKTPAVTSATVTGRYGAILYKRCAFLPTENYGRCNFGPEQVAELKQGDRVRVLSPLTRAQSGDDIYKVRTQQGWEGWARAEDLTLETR